MAGLAEIRAALATIVDGITIPADDPLPNVPFREASYEEPLAQLKPRARRTETVRMFQVLADPMSEQRGPSQCFFPTHELQVVVRYDVRNWKRDAEEHLTTVAYGDQARICKAALRAPLSTRWPAHMEEVEFLSADPIEESDHNGIWTATMRFLVEYKLGD